MGRQRRLPEPARSIRGQVLREPEPQTHLGRRLVPRILNGDRDALRILRDCELVMSLLKHAPNGREIIPVLRIINRNW